MFSLLFFDWTHIPKTPFEMNTEHGKTETELGTKKTPKDEYQSKRKEILFLVIDNYGQPINMNVC